MENCDCTLTKNASKSYGVFSVFNTVLLCILGLVCFLPFWHIFSVSLSSGRTAAANLVKLWPMEFSLSSYVDAFSDEKILTALFVSLKRVFLGTSITMILTILTAYPLSFESSEFPGRKAYVCYFVFTMLFSGGLIPSYILINNIMHMTDTIWAITVPGALPFFNAIILLNFFRQLPKEIKEAAKVDGAGYFITLVKIYLPLSLPSLTVLTLFCIIGHWNAWFDALMFMRDPSNYPLQTYFQVISTKMVNIQSLSDVKRMGLVSRRSLMCAYTIICILPVVFAFPVLQRHIRSGLVIGSVKG